MPASEVVHLHASRADSTAPQHLPKIDCLKSANTMTTQQHANKIPHITVLPQTTALRLCKYSGNRDGWSATKKLAPISSCHDLIVLRLVGWEHSSPNSMPIRSSSIALEVIMICNRPFLAAQLLASATCRCAALGQYIGSRAS